MTTHHLHVIPARRWADLSHPERDAYLKRGVMPGMAGADGDNDDGGDGGDGGGSGSGDRASGGDDDGDSGDGDDDDGDSGDSELDRARKAAAKASRELRDIKRQREQEETKAAAEAGRYKELYEKEKARADQLEADAEKTTRSNLARAGLTVVGVKPERIDAALRLMDTEDLEDKRDAETAAKRLKRDYPEFFADRQRSKRGGGRNDDDDDRSDDRDDDDRDDRRRSRDRQPGVSRLRRGLEATSKGR